jgi:CRISPR-associated protein Cas8b1/Cst1 subtype I-B
MEFRLILLSLAAIGSVAHAEPSTMDLKVCSDVYENCTKQQASGKVKASCLTYEKENSEIMKYLKMVKDGHIKVSIGPDSSSWDLSLFSCSIKHDMFKTGEEMANAPDNAFKSGVNEYKYTVEE